jgi:hypothetical protein
MGMSLILTHVANIASVLKHISKNNNILVILYQLMIMKNSLQDQSRQIKAI